MCWWLPGPLPEIRASAPRARVSLAESRRSPGPLRSRRVALAATAARSQAPGTPPGSLWEAALIAAVYEMVIGLINSVNN